MPELAHKKTSDMDGRYSSDDPYDRLGAVHTCLYVRVREIGDGNLFRARGKQRGFIPRAQSRRVSLAVRQSQYGQCVCCFVLLTRYGGRRK